MPPSRNDTSSPPRTSRLAASLAVTCALGALAAGVVACSTQQITVVRPGSQDTVPGPTIPPSMRVRHDQPFPDERCAKNQEFGPITYLTNAEWTAAAGVLEVLVAEARGYFDDLCLDVTIVPSFATENYAKVAGNEAQFAAAGSFSEVADFAGRNNAKFITVAVDGRVPLDVLLVRPDGPTRPGQLRGAPIGAQAALTPAVTAMLARAGLSRVADDASIERDYTVVPLEDASAQLRLDNSNVVAVAGTVSSDVVELKAADVPFHTIDPVDHGVPGSFGVIYTNSAFAQENPTIVEDFLRAAARARTEAMADPATAVNDAKNIALQSPDAVFDAAFETARWTAEVKRMDRSPLTTPSGIPMPGLLANELAVGINVGLFGGLEPDAQSLIDVRPSVALYRSDRTLIWPSK